MFGIYITDDIFLGEMWRKVEGNGEWSAFYKGVVILGSSNPQFQTLIPYKPLFVKHIKPFFMPKKPYKNV